MANTNIMISVKNLVKKYDDFTAVKGISFDVYENEIFGLLGPNGAGKTTTLEIIETLREKTSGQVMVDGFDIETDADEIKQRIGVQLQAAGYYPNLNLSELIELFCGLYGIDKSPMEMLEKVALTDKAKSKYKELSGGQKQRFSIATTLINNPRIVFLDEPTTGLDPNQLVEIRELIKNIGKDKTVFLSTHIMQEVEAICDRVIIINHGKIVTDKKLKNLVKDTKLEQIIEVEFDKAVAEALLLTIPNLTAAKNTRANNWELTFNTETDMRPAMFDFAHDNGLKTLQLSLKNKNLESVFREMTKKK